MFPLPPIQINPDLILQINENMFGQGCVWMCTVALFMITPNWKKPVRPSTDEWINKSHRIRTTEHYSATKGTNYWYTGDNMNQSHVHHADWKMPDARGSVLHDSLYRTFWRRQNDGEKNRSVIEAGAGGRQWGQRAVTCSTSDCASDCAKVCVCQNSRNWVPKRENFTIYKLHFGEPD